MFLRESIEQLLQTGRGNQGGYFGDGFGACHLLLL
jgi:hypothetical protein